VEAYLAYIFTVFKLELNNANGSSWPKSDGCYFGTTTFFMAVKSSFSVFWSFDNNGLVFI